MLKVLAFVGLLVTSTAAIAQTGKPFAIGILTDTSGMNASVTGKGAVEAAKLAIEDFGGRVLDRPVEVISADHQNKPDIAGAIARKWFEEGTVEAIAEGTTSATAAAILTAAKQKSRVFLITGAGSPIFTNEQCSENSIHFTYDTNALARTIVAPLVKRGLDTWFFITVDYAGGHALQASIAPLVEKLGGKVIGSVFHPFGTSDFASFLLQAQASKAKVIVAANSSGDTVNTMKQAAEFNIGQDGKQVMATSLLFLSDVRGMGLSIAKGLYAGVSFYWDMSDDTRAFAKRFEARTGFPPEMTHAGTYSAVLHYLKAVQQENSVDAATVTKKMKEMLVNDFWNKNVAIRADGRVLHNFFLVQVKTPEESKGPSDLLKVLAEVPGSEVFQGLDEGKCAMAKVIR